MKSVKSSDRFSPRQLLRKHSLLIVVVLFVVGGTAFVVASRAATPFISAEPESGTVSSPAAKVTDATAAGGSAIKFMAAATPPPPVPSTWPGPNDTGYESAPDYPGSLTPWSGTVQSNTTYKFYSFPVGWGVPANVKNVTFYGCRFNGKNSEGNWNVSIQPGADNITFDYASFIPKDKAAPPAAYNDSSQFGLWQHPTNPGKVTVDHSEFWGFGNGIQFVSTNDPARPFTLKNSWMHDARADGGTDHTDGILNGSNDGSYTVVHHNTIVSEGNTNAIAFQDNTDRNLTITDNYVSGFGYTVLVGRGTNTNVTFTGNTFGTDIKPVFGPLYGWPGGTGNVWRNNKWRVAPGTTWSPASNDGKFWTPNGISATDYTGN